MRNTTSWNPLADETVEKGLSGDLFTVKVYDEKLIIGMGRVIGDGAIYFYLQDIIVDPAYQDQGIGHLIMERIEAFLREKAPQNAFIGLMAARGVRTFYQRYGYSIRDEKAPGMFKVMV